MPNNDERPRKTWVMLKKAVKGIALNSLPIGTLVKDPNSTFLGAPVIWKVADINHQGYPDNSVTLITERCISMLAFDARELSSSEAGIRNVGNARYSMSNIRQWLNSDANAGQWYTAQHSIDQTPSSTSYVTGNPYTNKVGFLNGFSSDFKKSLLDTTVIVGVTSIYGGGSELVTDKIFLASSNEVGLGTTNIVTEGTILPIFNNNKSSRVVYCTEEAIIDSKVSTKPANSTTGWRWWLRTFWTPYSIRGVHDDGALNNFNSNEGSIGVRPLCNLPSTVRVSETPDENGVYTIVQFK